MCLSTLPLSPLTHSEVARQWHMTSASLDVVHAGEHEHESQDLAGLAKGGAEVEGAGAVEMASAGRDRAGRLSDRLLWMTSDEGATALHLAVSAGGLSSAKVPPARGYLSLPRPASLHLSLLFPAPAVPCCPGVCLLLQDLVKSQATTPLARTCLSCGRRERERARETESERANEREREKRERGGKGGQRYQERDDGVWLDQLLVAHGGAELVCKGDNSGTNSAKSAL
jgi:hypothetical protein